jgi:hypothetical protein
MFWLALVLHPLYYIVFTSHQHNSYTNNHTSYYDLPEVFKFQITAEEVLRDYLLCSSGVMIYIALHKFISTFSYA